MGVYVRFTGVVHIPYIKPWVLYSVPQLQCRMPRNNSVVGSCPQGYLAVGTCNNGFCPNGGFNQGSCVNNTCCQFNPFPTIGMICCHILCYPTSHWLLPVICRFRKMSTWRPNISHLCEWKMPIWLHLHCREYLLQLYCCHPIQLYTLGCPFTVHVTQRLCICRFLLPWRPYVCWSMHKRPMSNRVYL